MFESVKSYDETFHMKARTGEQPYPKLQAHPSLEFLREAYQPVRLGHGLWQLWENPNPKLERAQFRKKPNVPNKKKDKGLQEEQKTNKKGKIMNIFKLMHHSIAKRHLRKNWIALWMN